MHPVTSEGGARYIIRAGDSGRLSELVRRMQEDPAIQLLDVIGPDGAPHTVVVSMGPEMAAALEMQFRASNHFTIEPDRPLSLFGGTAGPAGPDER